MKPTGPLDRDLERARARAETRVAERVARIERHIEDHELVERALLTLSTPGAPAIDE